MPRTRKYGTKKTTSQEGKREYMQPFMKDYRQKERDMIRNYKRMMGISNGRVKKKK